MGTFIDKVKILSLEIKLYGDREQDQEYDLGALTLKREGREYILDSVSHVWEEQGGFSTIHVGLKRDDESFSTCEYDLKGSDFMYKDLEAEFYLGGTFSSSIEQMTLFVKSGDMTQAINVNQE